MALCSLVQGCQLVPYNYNDDALVGLAYTRHYMTIYTHIGINMYASYTLSHICAVCL